MKITDKLIAVIVPECLYDFSFDNHRKHISATEQIMYDSSMDWFSEKIPYDCEILGKLSEIKEEECGRFVDVLIGLGEWIYYDYIDNIPNGFITAKESLTSLIESKGIDTSNPNTILLIEKL